VLTVICITTTGLSYSFLYWQIGDFVPLCRKGHQGFCIMASAGFSVSLQTPENQPHPLYVLGLANSKLIFWNLRQISNKLRGGWITCTKQYVGTLPIRCIDCSDPTDRQMHDAIVSRVEEMLNLQARLAPLRHTSSSVRDDLLREVDRVDSKLTRLCLTCMGLPKRGGGW
jgi:hypothetical protein